MSDKGWLKLHRVFKNWEWYNEPNTMRVYLHCLLSANHREDKKLRGIKLEKGEFVSSIRRIAEELELTPRKVRTALENLKTTHNLTIKATHLNSIIKVENWELYQGAYNDSDTANDTLNDKQTTQQRHSGDTATINNDNNNIYNIYNKKNEKNIKENTILSYSSKERVAEKETKHFYGEFKHVLLTEKQYEKLQLDFPNEYEEMIKNLDEYLEMKNVSYKNHNLVMRNWKNKERKEKSSAKKEKKKDVNIDWLEEYL